VFKRRKQMQKERLKNKVAIITGGAQGIGRAYAMGMADEGAKLVIADLNMKAADQTVQAVQSKGCQAVAIETDVASPENTLAMAQLAVDNFGRIDILVNNAAILGKVKVSRVPFYELALEEWDRVMAVNLKGTLLCCRAVFPQMKLQENGKIINVSSTGYFYGHANYVHYVASKAGVLGLTRSLARELGDYNINVNCIVPGATMAEDPDDKAAVAARVSRITERSLPRRCIKRVEYPEDLVGTAIFLASSDSDFITGQAIVVDGGEVMH
jgi:3-oxoacyl-[acyl-carrier protein] reductase